MKRDFMVIIRSVLLIEQLKSAENTAVSDKNQLFFFKDLNTLRTQRSLVNFLSI